MPRIAAAFHFPGLTQEKYDAMIEDFKAAEAADENLAKERVIHVGMPEEGGWFAFDVWESAEAFERLGVALGPIMEKHGITPVAPTVYPVHNTMT